MVRGRQQTRCHCFQWEHDGMRCYDDFTKQTVRKQRYGRLLKSELWRQVPSTVADDGIHRQAQRYLPSCFHWKQWHLVCRLPCKPRHNSVYPEWSVRFASWGPMKSDCHPQTLQTLRKYSLNLRMTTDSIFYLSFFFLCSKIVILKYLWHYIFIKDRMHLKVHTQ